MQWIKRFWDQNCPGTPYDPAARRKGAPTDTPHTLAPVAPRKVGGPGLTAGGGRPGGKTPVGGKDIQQSAEPRLVLIFLLLQVLGRRLRLRGPLLPNFRRN